MSNVDSLYADLLAQDWADLKHYRQDNLDRIARGKTDVVLLGNSITEGWAYHYPELLAQHPTWANRGISGQTTPQLLVRFRPDVLALSPKVVIILAGINDIAGNTGRMSLDETMGNLVSMAELAAANDVQVILCSVLPAFAFPWRPGMAPAQEVLELNRKLAAYATAHGHRYLDYYTAMADDRPGLRAGLHEDEVHPNRKGYALMAPLLEAAVAEAFATDKPQH